MPIIQVDLMTDLLSHILHLSRKICFTRWASWILQTLERLTLAKRKKQKLLDSSNKKMTLNPCDYRSCSKLGQHIDPLQILFL